MASSVHESEKEFKSILLNTESFKEDREILRNKYVYKKKFDFLTPGALIGMVAFLIVSFAISMYMLIGVVVCAILFLVFLVIRIKKNNHEFISYYKDAIRKNCTLNYPEDSYAISSLFPIYAKWDNENKIIDIIYQNNTKIHCGFDDILNYRLLLEEEEIEDTLLPPKPDPTKVSFSLEITFNNMKKSMIRFSNAVYKVDFRYLYNIESNAEAINNLSTILDQIIKKNEIKM